MNVNSGDLPLYILFAPLLVIAGRRRLKPESPIFLFWGFNTGLVMIYRAKYRLQAESLSLNCSSGE